MHDAARERFARTAERVAEHQDARAAELEEKVVRFVAPEGNERARDPSHTRALADIDLRGLFEANSLVLLRAEYEREPRDLDAYLELAGCEGEARERAATLAPPNYTAELGWYLLEKR